MTRPYPYPPGSFTPADGKQPGLETFSRLTRRRWKFTNLGTFKVRPMNGHPHLSTHSLGVAADFGYGAASASRKAVLEALQWLVEHNFKLGVVAIHDYAAPGAPRAWRCDRGEWRTFTNGELGAGYRGFHVELEQHMAAMDAATYEALWRSIPKP